MGSDIRFGAALGVLMAAASVLSNVARADRHTVSLAPDLLTLLAIVAVLFVGLEARRRRVIDRASERRAGLRTTLVAAVVFGVLLMAFAILWMPHAAPAFRLTVLLMTFLCALALGGLFVWARTVGAA